MAAVAYGGLGTVAVFAIYKLIKRFGKTSCAVDHCSGCLSINSPADLELTQRGNDKLEEIINNLINKSSDTAVGRDQSDPIPPGELSHIDPMGVLNPH